METVLTVCRRTNLTTNGELHIINPFLLANLVTAYSQGYELFLKRYGLEWRGKPLKRFPFTCKLTPG
jgi:hypothetical protein